MRHRPLRSRVLAPLAILARGAAAAPASAERVRIALLPVVVHSSESREYLQPPAGALGHARGARGARAGPCGDRGRGGRRGHHGPGGGPRGGQAGRRSLGWVVFGAFTRFDEGASLQVARVEGEGEAQRVFAQAATLGALIPMLDGVAERITARVFGRDGSVPPPSAALDGGEVAELRRRVEALERAVDQLGAARMPAEPKATPDLQPPGPQPERE